jgi:ribosome-binding protein aMBF1 (putative translation factor)
VTSGSSRKWLELFPEVLVEARMDAGLSRDQLAKKVGVTLVLSVVLAKFDPRR